MAAQAASTHLRAKEDEKHDEAHNKGPRYWGCPSLAHGLVKEHCGPLCLQGPRHLQAVSASLGAMITALYYFKLACLTS